MKTAPIVLTQPTRNPLVKENGTVDNAWSAFFRELERLIAPLGQEKSCQLVNNQVSDVDIEDLFFDKTKASFAAVDYLIQRVTTGGGAVEQVEAGTFFAYFRPTSDDWVLASVPSTAGVTLSITPEGQVQYTTTSIAGTHSISKITFRSRTLAAKNSQYSQAGS